MKCKSSRKAVTLEAQKRRKISFRSNKMRPRNSQQSCNIHNDRQLYSWWSSCRIAVENGNDWDGMTQAERDIMAWLGGWAEFLLNTTVFYAVALALKDITHRRTIALSSNRDSRRRWVIEPASKLPSKLYEKILWLSVVLLIQPITWVKQKWKESNKAVQ